ARRRDLRDQPVDREQEEDVGHVRVDQGVEQELQGRHRVAHDPGAAEAEGDVGRVRPVQGGPAHGRQQRGQITGLEVGDLELDGLLGTDVDAVPDRVLGPVGVAAVERGQVPDPRHGVVENLPAEVAGEVAAAAADGV